VEDDASAVVDGFQFDPDIEGVDRPSRKEMMPKTSTETAPPCRKACAAASCSVSWFTNGIAVFAAAKRCDRTKPFRAAGSFDGTSGMWQSLQVCDAGG
jgi:hypothetical protein